MNTSKMTDEGCPRDFSFIFLLTFRFFFKIFLTLAMLFYSGLDSKNKQNTDNIKALQVTYLFPKFTLRPRAFTGFIVYFWSLAHKRFDMFPQCNLYE